MDIITATREAFDWELIETESSLTNAENRYII